MKKALVDCLVTGIGGTEFEDGSKVVKVQLEDFTSFNLPPESPLLKKINIGTTFDLTYNYDKEKPSTTGSGAEVVYHNLTGVKVLTETIKQGEEDENLKKLADVTKPDDIVFKKVGGGGTTGTGAQAPVKV